MPNYFYKNYLAGSRKWMSRCGRFLAFIAQALLYYMALGQLLFATADVSSLGVQGLADSQQPLLKRTARMAALRKPA